MTELHKSVFDAIHALPRPVTATQCEEEGLKQIPLGPQQKQFKDWMQTSGAKLAQMLNEGRV
jgi:hypothetical protein